MYQWVFYVPIGSNFYWLMVGNMTGSRMPEKSFSEAII